MKHGLNGLLILYYPFVTVLFIKLQNMYATVLYSYKKHVRIVRLSDENAMMHALDGLLLSLMHNNVTRVDFFDYLFYTVLFTKLQNMYD